jgi:hypothetical protein
MNILTIVVVLLLLFIPSIVIERAEDVMYNATKQSQDIAHVGVTITSSPYGTNMGNTTKYSCTGDTCVSNNAPLIKVTPDFQHPGRRIPVDFLGLSYDAKDLADKTGFVPSNLVLKQLLTNLGIGVLRFGGTGVDIDTAWSRTNETFKDYPFVLSPADLDRLFGFTKQVGWKTIIGLNLKMNDPNRAADEALYATQKGGKSVMAFEISNEPDLFTNPVHAFRPTGWSWSNFEKEFDSYVKTIRSKVPNAPIADPSTCCNDKFFTNFLTDRSSKLSFATHHIYPLNANILDPTSPEYASIGNLLSRSTTKHVNDRTDLLVSAARSHNISLRIDETNSASGEGKDGVSNVFAASLWGIDYTFNLLEHGVSGVNFQGGFNCPEYRYTPFCKASGVNYEVRPLYYAMLLFKHASPGRVVSSVVNSSELNVVAHSTLGDDGKLHVILVNNDAKDMLVEINVGSSYSNASIMRLIAPSLTARDNITLGGESVSSDGTWSPKIQELIQASGGIFKVPLPMASAILVNFETNNAQFVSQNMLTKMIAWLQKLLEELNDILREAISYVAN